jgi:hypothetical protein
MKKLLDGRFKIPFGSRNAAKEIQAKRIVFRKCVASEVRFGKQTEAGDAAGSRELMPLRFADRAQFHATYHPMEERFHRPKVAQRFR